MYKDPSTSKFPEDNPAHPDHDSAVAKAWAGDKRNHLDLRDLVEAATAGVMPHIADRVKDVARRAYYLGCVDGMEVQKQLDKEAA